MKGVLEGKEKEPLRDAGGIRLVLKHSTYCAKVKVGGAQSLILGDKSGDRLQYHVWNCGVSTCPAPPGHLEGRAAST